MGLTGGELEEGGGRHHTTGQERAGATATGSQGLQVSGLHLAFGVDPTAYSLCYVLHLRDGNDPTQFCNSAFLKDLGEER